MYVSQNFIESGDSVDYGTRFCRNRSCGKHSVVTASSVWQPYGDGAAAPERSQRVQSPLGARLHRARAVAWLRVFARGGRERVAGGRDPRVRHESAEAGPLLSERTRSAPLSLAPLHYMLRTAREPRLPLRRTKRGLIYDTHLESESFYSVQNLSEFLMRHLYDMTKYRYLFIERVYT